MICVWLILASIGLFGFSGIPASLLSGKSAVGQILTTGLMLTGSLLGLAGIILSYTQIGPFSVQWQWFLPWGQFAVSLDHLSTFFLLLILVIPTLGSCFGLGYWKQSDHQQNGQKLGLSYGLLVAGMALVVIARDGVLFLIAWEIMALAAFFALTTEDEKPEIRRAGWIYLVATHIGTLFLFAMFAVWNHATGSFALDSPVALSAELGGTIFGLALVGFGFKAGLMPFHIWLPGAHANAPGHVSAVMSGVMLKMGIYGIFRMTSLLTIDAEWWGILLLCIGIVSGVAGIAYALGQSDIKRLLAYSSVENVGIIVMGMGLGLLGRFWGRADLEMLGIGAALFHVWNHGLFKPLLFFNAGAVIHTTDTREMDKLGGLARSMPWTMTIFMIGAMAITALPPLNGFSSEWLLYRGLFQSIGPAGMNQTTAVAAAAAALALIGAMAIACFVKLGSTVFLGTPRNVLKNHPHEASASLLFPMGILAFACIGIGLFPGAVLTVLGMAIQSWTGHSLPIPLTQLFQSNWITMVGLAILLFSGVILVILKVRVWQKKVRQTITWDCGYAQPASSQQYSGSSLTLVIVRLFGAILVPRKVQPVINLPFPRVARHRFTIPDAVLVRLVLPIFRYFGRQIPRIRYFQQGQTQWYVLYILLASLMLLFLGGWRFDS